MKKSTFFIRVAAMLLVILILPLTGFSQHFTPPTNNGAGNWHFYPVTATIGGIALEAGDEIAVFDGATCVGAHVLTSALDGSYALAIANDWMSYETNNGDAGYNGGNSYTFKCWDASASTVYTGAMTYNTTYTPQDYVGGTFPATMTFRWSWIDLVFSNVAPTAGDLTGTITNSAGGAPISGVSVTATGTATYVTTTNASGVYLFDDIDVDTYAVTTVHADFQNGAAAGVGVTDGGTTTEDFVLTYKTGTLDGFVYDQASAVVDGATVTLDGGGGTDDSDVTGAYEITGIAPGIYTATVTEPGYANTVLAGIVISPNATTSQNFTINTSGTLSGTVTDGTNGGGEDGVLVSIDGTATTTTTAGGGLFSFTLSPGTYALSYTKSGFHAGANSSLVVTAGNTTNADESIYEENWTFSDGDPFSNVWTVYLNTVTGDGTALKAGDELSVWAPDERADITAYAPFESGNISSVAAMASGSATAFDSPAGESGAITSVGDGSPEAEFNSGTLPANASVVDIFGTSNYNAVSQTVTASGAGVFETSAAYGADETGSWVLSSSSSTTVTSTAHGLSNGASVTITGNASYNGTYTISGVAANTFDIALKWAGAGTASWAVNTSSTVTTAVAHGLSNGDIITITGTTGYNGTHAITNASGSVFDVAVAFTSTQAGVWANNTATTVTSTGHGRSNGESVTISGSTYYNGTWTVANAGANTFEIADPFVANDATGKWVYGEQMVGLYYLTGPISGAGTAHDLKAFSVLNDASTGYESGEDFVFKLSYAGGSVLTTLNSISWTATGGGLTDPSTTFPSGSAFSKVDLDFDLPPGHLEVKFLDELAAAPESDLDLNLKLNGGSVGTGTFPALSVLYFDYAGLDLDAGEYTLTVSGERFADTTYTGIVVAPGATTTKDFVVEHFADETQTISLYSGYQLISRRVDDDTYDMSDYIGGTMAPTPPTLTKVDMTKDEDGTSDTYSGGVLTDGGVDWKIKRGYNFKMNASDAMVITGTPIAYDATIAVRATAFSMISYLPDYTLDAEVAFADLMTSDLDYIRDGDGNSLTKVGGIWVDHIGNCTPGEGFLIKWIGALTDFNYPAQTKSGNANNENSELVHFPFYSGYGNPMSDVFTMYISGDDLEVGDEIGAFDGSTLVGATVITSDNAMDNNLNTFEELFDKSGFDNGNQIILKVWKANEDKEYFLNFENISEGENMYHGVVYPNSDGNKSTMDVTLSPTGIIDNLAEYINVYPNPSKGFVTISSPEQIDRLLVVNLVGQTLIDIKPESGNTELNLDGFNPGIYFVNLIIDGQRVTKKLTIQ